MSTPTHQAQPASQSHDDAVPLRPVTLRDVLADCGGPLAVAKALTLAPTTIYDWQRRGRVPDSDLKGEGGTSYSDVIAGMQRNGVLTAGQIRRLGRRL